MRRRSSAAAVIKERNLEVGMLLAANSVPQCYTCMYCTYNSYTYVHTYVHMYIRTYVSCALSSFVLIRTYVCHKGTFCFSSCASKVHIYVMYSFVHIYIVVQHVYVHTYVRTYIHRYVNSCTMCCTYVHVYICTCVHNLCVWQDIGILEVRTYSRKLLVS